MAECYVGQIMMSGFGFTPRGFAACNGQMLPVMQNQALFALLGVTYGGDGKTTFGVPDLRGTTPVNAGTSADPAWQPPVTYTLGQKVGTETVTLQTTQLPAHNHQANASTVPGGSKVAAASLYGNSNAEAIYAPATGPQVIMDASTIASTGGDGSHNNMQPFQVINFSICLSGYFPTRS